MYQESRDECEGRRWTSWHNHTGEEPRFSYCCSPDVTVETYRKALDEGPWEAFGITDHAFALALPESVPFWPQDWFYTPEVVAKHRAFREDKTAAYLARNRAACDGVRLVSGVEVEVAADGSTALHPAVWDAVDFVIGSVHYLPRRREDPYGSYLHVVEMLFRHPIHLFAHPFRILADLGPLPDEVFEETLRRVKAAGLAVEVNAHTPSDDDPRLVRRAVELGIPISFGIDCHHVSELANHAYFAEVLDRAGVAIPASLRFDPRRAAGAAPRNAPAAGVP